MSVQGKPAILALCQRPWLIYAHANKQIITPLSYPHIDVATSAKSVSNPHTICGVSDKNLVFLNIQNFGQMLNSQVIPLTYSGRKIVLADKKLAILEYEKIPSDI